MATLLGAADYFVDRNHPVASDSNPGTLDQPWESIDKANHTLVAGDVVHIRAGTYPDYIAPANSGSEGNRIVYRNHESEVVTIQDAEYGIRLDGDDHIMVSGINFTNLDRFMFLENGAEHNVIEYCNFDQVRNRDSWAGSRIWKHANYNWVHHCRFSRYGECSASGSDNGSVLEVGYDVGDSSYGAHYNLLEHNTLFHGGHHVLGLHGTRNVLRHNYLHNEAWSRGRGNRTLWVCGREDVGGRNLVEHNRFGYAAPPCDAEGVGGVALASSGNIFRFNAFYHNNLQGLGLACYSVSDCNHNRVYNNTFFNNAHDPHPSFDSRYRGPILLSDWTASETKYNAFKNNLYYAHVNSEGVVYGQNGVDLSDQTFANNFDGDTEGDPLFVNASPAPPEDKMDASLPDLRLRGGSPAIDAGSYLTTITSAGGSGTTFAVADAGYFMDGWGIIEGDTIRLFETGQTALVVEVDYAGHQITVDRELTWTSGQGVSLPYSGSAPDAGAHEVPTGTPPAVDSDGDGLSVAFESAHGEGGELDPMSDLDHDNLTALEEFVHGLDPNAPSEAQPVFGKTTIDMAGYFSITYELDPMAMPFVVVTVEHMRPLEDPAGWRTGGTTLVSWENSPIRPEMFKVVERSKTPIVEQQIEFFRLRYEATESGP